MAYNRHLLEAMLMKYGFGRIYDHTSDPDIHLRSYYDLVISGLLQNAADYRNSPSCKGKFPELYVNISESTHVNAVAIRIGGDFYITICRGTFVLLSETFHRLLCMPDVFVCVGDVSAERPGRIATPLPRDASLLTNHTRYVPIDPTRAMAAGIMAATALQFLVRHEWRHLQGGHLNYSFATLNMPMLFEASSTGTAVDRNMIDQAMEIEADTHATVRLVEKYMYDSGLRNKLNPVLRKCPDPEETAVALVLTSICGCIKLFSKPLPPYEKWADNTHPPAEVRQFTIVNSVQDHLRKWGRDDLAKRFSITREVHEAIDTALHQLLGDPPLTDEWRQLFAPHGKCMTHAQRLIGIRQSIQNELDKISYIELDDDRGSA
jgi:hypothetical protein